MLQSLRFFHYLLIYSKNSWKTERIPWWLLNDGISSCLLDFIKSNSHSKCVNAEFSEFISWKFDQNEKFKLWNRRWCAGENSCVNCAWVFFLKWMRKRRSDSICFTLGLNYAPPMSRCVLISINIWMCERIKCVIFVSCMLSTVKQIKFMQSNTMLGEFTFNTKNAILKFTFFFWQFFSFQWKSVFSSAFFYICKFLPSWKCEKLKWYEKKHQKWFVLHIFVNAIKREKCMADGKEAAPVFTQCCLSNQQWNWKLTPDWQSQQCNDGLIP